MVNESDKSIILNCGLREILKSNQWSDILSDNSRMGIYLVRIYLGRYNIWVFKAGETREIELLKKLSELNDRYKCEGKIMLICFGKAKFLNAEKDIHLELNEFRLNGYVSEHGTNPQELYKLSYEFYNTFMQVFKNKVLSNYYESNNYIITNKNKEYYQLKLDEAYYLQETYENQKKFLDGVVDQFENNEHYYILLDKKKYENAFWHMIDYFYNPRENINKKRKLNNIETTNYSIL